MAKEKKEINVGFPETQDLDLRFRVGACRLKLSPGEPDTWVSGTYHDPSNRLPARVIQEDGSVLITQDRDVLDLFGLLEGTPRFDLQLGTAKPYSMHFEGGASEDVLDLGGLPLKRLVFKHGAGKNQIDFTSPNPQSMSLLDIDAGAGSLDIVNVANANAVEMRIDAGAASIVCDFGGELKQDLFVRISTGMASVVLKIPASTAAKVRCESVLAGVHVDDGFTRKDGAYWNAAAVRGVAPLMSIDTSVTMGSLAIRTV